MKQRKLNNKIYILTIVGTVIALIIMVVYNYLSLYGSATGNLYDIGMSNLGEVTEQIESYLDKSENVFQATAVSIEYMLEDGASSEEIRDVLMYESERYKADVDKNFTGVYGVFDGVYIDGIGWQPEDDFDPTTREWYTEAVSANGKSVVISPYVDAQTGQVMISISQLMKDKQSVISIDIKLDAIQEIIANVSMGGNGYGVVVDNKGLVVAHDSEAEKGKNYLEDSNMSYVVREALAGVDCYKVKLSGERSTVYSEKIHDNWYALMIVSDEKLYADVNDTLFRNIMISGCIAIMVLLFYVLTFIKLRRSAEMDRVSNLKVENLNKKMVHALARTIDAKDRYTNGHSQRVANYAVKIAKRMNKSEEELKVIYNAGLLHDVGKIRIPEDIINKPGRLTPEEFEQIKIHPITGFHVLKDIYDDKTIALGAKFHHERFDGKGYPNGLKGENIPEIARIICVADTYDAMASNRSYREAMPQTVIREEFVKNSGTQFDPAIADIMIQMIDEDTEYKMRETDSLKKNILVVEDELINYQMIEQALSDEPMYETVNAVSGHDALKLLDKRSIHLILLDVHLTDMDGFDALKFIRQRSDVPVVFLTDDRNIETINKAAEVGVDDYITKPILPLALKEIIHSTLNN